MRVLGESERRMYSVLREHGRAMFQRTSSGIFSRAKVSRVLDRFEEKRVVVREHHGMMNRVRIIDGTTK